MCGLTQSQPTYASNFNFHCIMSEVASIPIPQESYDTTSLGRYRC